MTSSTPHKLRTGSRLNPKIPRWLGWAFFAFMAQLMVTFLAVLVGGKGGFGVIWLLWPGLPQVVFGLGIIPSYLTDATQARMLWRLFACMFIYTFSATGFISLLVPCNKQTTPPAPSNPAP